MSLGAYVFITHAQMNLIHRNNKWKRIILFTKKANEKLFVDR